MPKRVEKLSEGTKKGGFVPGNEFLGLWGTDRSSYVPERGGGRREGEDI